MTKSIHPPRDMNSKIHGVWGEGDEEIIKYVAKGMGWNDTQSIKRLLKGLGKTGGIYCT